MVMTNDTSNMASVAAYATSGLEIIFSLTVNEWATIIGAFCAVGTFLVNRRFKNRILEMKAQQLKAGGTGEI